VDAPELHRRLREALKDQVFAEFDYVEPVLINALLTDQDPRIRTKAFELSKFGPLTSHRALLAAAIGECGVEAPELHRLLLEALKDQTFPVFDLVEPVLVNVLLTDQDAKIRTKASELLSRFGPPRSSQSIEALLRAMEGKTEAIRGAALDCLLTCDLQGWDAAAPILLRAMKDARPERRRAAVGAWRGLGLDRASAAVPALREALKDEEAAVRLETLSTLAWLGTEAEAAVPEVLDVLLDKHDETLQRADVGTLAAIDPEHRLTLPRLAEITGVAAREALLKILCKIGPEARPLRRRLQASWSAGQEEQPTSPAPQPTEGSPASGGGHTDPGPREPCLLRWNNTDHRVPPIPYRLLCCLWGREKVPVEEVTDRVWGGVDVTDFQIKSALNDLEKVMKKAGVPWKYGQLQGCFLKKERL
jgi:HEAT repeat protein